MTVVLASAGTATTSTVNSSSRGRGRIARAARLSRRGQRVEHAAGISARGGKRGVVVGERPAALGPLVLGNGAHGAVRGHGLRGAVADCGGGHGDGVLVDGRVIAWRAAGVVVAGEATDSHLQIDGLGRRRGDRYGEGAKRVRN